MSKAVKNWGESCDSVVASLRRYSCYDRLDGDELVGGIRYSSVRDFPKGDIDLIKFADASFSNLNGFSAWFHELIAGIEENNPENIRKLLLRARKRLEAGGYPEVLEVEQVFREREVRQFYETVISTGKPFIDPPESTEMTHGRYSHLMQWTYLLEAMSPPQFTALSQIMRRKPFLWNKLFDDDPGIRHLRNPGKWFDILGV